MNRGDGKAVRRGLAKSSIDSSRSAQSAGRWTETLGDQSRVAAGADGGIDDGFAGSGSEIVQHFGRQDRHVSRCRSRRKALMGVCRDGEGRKRPAGSPGWEARGNSPRGRRPTQSHDPAASAHAAQPTTSPSSVLVRRGQRCFGHTVEAGRSRLDNSASVGVPQFQMIADTDRYHLMLEARELKQPIRNREHGRCYPRQSPPSGRTATARKRASRVWPASAPASRISVERILRVNPQRLIRPRRDEQRRRLLEQLAHALWAGPCASCRRACGDRFR